MSAIGDRVKKLRIQLGLAQSAFADNIGVKGGVVSAWERGTAPVPYGRLLMMCDAYRVSGRWLRTGAGPMFADEPTEEFKTPKECAKEYLFSLLDRMPPDLRQTALEFCRDALKRYDFDGEERPERRVRRTRRNVQWRKGPEKEPEREDDRKKKNRAPRPKRRARRKE